MLINLETVKIISVTLEPHEQATERHVSRSVTRKRNGNVVIKSVIGVRVDVTFI